MVIADITARALHIPFKAAFTPPRRTHDHAIDLESAGAGGDAGKDAPEALRASSTGHARLGIALQPEGMLPPEGFALPHWGIARWFGTAAPAGLGEGCPREYVTGESVASALAFVAAHRHDWRSSIRDVATLSGGWSVIAPPSTQHRRRGRPSSSRCSTSSDTSRGVRSSR
jgi:hypothetical protein